MEGVIVLSNFFSRTVHLFSVIYSSLIPLLIHCKNWCYHYYLQTNEQMKEQHLYLRLSLMHQKNCTEDWTDMMGLGALHCCAKSCKIEWIYHWHREASEAAGACWARSTISSVVVPMISFARFNGTHRILPIESWVENYCKDQPTEHLGLEILIWHILLLLKITVVALKVTQKMTFFIHICSVLFWWSLEFAKRTYPRNNTQLF